MSNDVEVGFRKDVVKPKKRAKALNDYIIYLIENEHILEADYHHKKLLELKPGNEKCLAIGYKIAIRMFNFDRIVFFDKKLIEIKASEETIMSLKLEYYCSINSKQGMKSCTEWFLERNSISTEHIELLIEATLILEEFKFISKLLKHMRKKGLRPSTATERSLKRISIEELAKTLRKVSHEFV